MTAVVQAFAPCACVQREGVRTRARAPTHRVVRGNNTGPKRNAQRSLQLSGSPRHL